MHLTAYIARKPNGLTLGHFASRAAAERRAAKHDGIVVEETIAVIAEVFGTSEKREGLRCLVRLEMSLGLGWDVIAWVRDGAVSYGGNFSTDPHMPDWVAEFFPALSADILSQI